MLACLITQGEDNAAWFETLSPLLAAQGISLVQPSLVPSPDTELAIVANPPKSALATLSKLRLIASLWAGVDALLRDTSLPVNIPILRSRDEGMRESMGESAMAHVLAAHLRLPLYRHQQSLGIWQQHECEVASEKTVLVLGLGYLGAHCAKRIRGLGFQVLGYAHSPKPELAELGITVATNEAALAHAMGAADIVLNLMPTTADTKEFFNSARFVQFKRGASFINLARGAQVNEVDLLAALDSDQLASAALDVFQKEPLASGHAFWQHSKVVVTPHIAAPSHFHSVARSLSRDIQTYFTTGKSESLVLRTRGY